MTPTEIEYAIRSYAMDLLELSKKLGVGAISVHVSPETMDHYSGAWWELSKTKGGHTFEWFSEDDAS